MAGDKRMGAPDTVDGVGLGREPTFRAPPHPQADPATLAAMHESVNRRMNEK
jgi:hypothetical protein